MTVFYPDISHYQAGLNLTGAPLVIAKATQGGSYTDPAYAGFKAQAEKLNIPFAAYHWVNFENLQVQAEHAYSVAGKTPVMWDCETGGDTVSRIVDLTIRYRALGGIVHLCYLPRWLWNQIGVPELGPLTNAGLALVSSDYPSGGYSDSGPGWDSYGGVTPTIWQYTDAQLFNGQRVDFNAYQGTLTELWNLITGGSMTITDPDVSKIVEAIMNRQINGARIADILGRLDAMNKTVPGELTSLAEAVGAINTGAGTPATLDLQAIAAAVADEEARRLQS